MKELYKKIIEVLLAEELWAETELKQFEIIDLWKKQLIAQDEFEDLAFPSVFVEMKINYSSGTEKAGNYEGTMNVNLYIAVDASGNTSNLSDDIDKALEIFDYAKLVQSAVDGVTTSTCGKLKRTVVDHPEFIVQNSIVLSYEAEILEDNVGEKYEYVEDNEVQLTSKLKVRLA